MELARRRSSTRMADSKTRIREGLPHPLGATWDGLGVNFALFSAYATKVELCLFDATGRREIERDRAARVHRRGLARLPARPARRGAIYGYRVHGPYEPDAGHRFNPNKLLLDPYAKGHVGKLEWRPEIFGYTIGARGRGPLLRRARQRSVRAEVPGDRPRVHVDARPAARHAVGAHHHLRDPRQGLDQAPPARARGAPRHLRGARLPGRPRAPQGSSASPRSSCCRSTPSSTTAICSTRSSPTTGATTPSASSPPSPATSPTATRPSSRRWSRTSTTPGSRSSSTWSTTTPRRATSAGRRCRSRASTTRRTTAWYPDATRYYINDTGTGNTVNLSHPRVLQMVTDSLRYWVDRDARRRLPLRPRDHPRPRALRLRRGRRLPRLAAGRIRCSTR